MINPLAPKVTIELIPSSSWGTNVRELLGQSKWDRVRRQVYERAGNRCELCGACHVTLTGTRTSYPVECHEVWEYDDERHVQRLVRMIALCPACHSVKHYGRTSKMGYARVAEAHLARVNGWTDREVTEHITEAKTQYEQRRAFPWELDLSTLHDYGIDPATIGPVTAERPTDEVMRRIQAERNTATEGAGVAIVRCRRTDGSVA